jgi:hypothetical protein
MRIIICCLGLLLIVSCSQSSKNNDSAVNLLADRSCRAISIRQQRFELANKIRFAQDTLAQAKNKNDSRRLGNELKLYFSQKDVLLKESLCLADTIRKQLDSLVPYTDKAAQKRFTARVDSLLAKKGCKVDSAK